ncbi:MAG: hypothetical protein JSV04_07995 [Candidatus Heimdallarchaeota archaeon]|nr:MAG: hypothetical protein JSV04_07995 [Candidatus Heimdallarchaeota archaeon]
MLQKHTEIGKCSIIVQGKILVNLEGKNLPKIGTYAKIRREGKFKEIGEVVEVIGSTRNPWIVISARKGSLRTIQHEETVYTEDYPKRERKKKGKKSQKRRS